MPGGQSESPRNEPVSTSTTLRLPGQRHTPSCPPIWYGFWGVNSGSQAHKVCTVLPTDSPRKGLLAGEIIQSLQLNLRAQARPPISLHHDYSSSLHLLDNLSMKREHPALPYLTNVHLLLEWVYTLLLWKRTFFFCLHLNSLQHKMNDYNISFSLPLLKVTLSPL